MLPMVYIPILSSNWIIFSQHSLQPPVQDPTEDQYCNLQQLIFVQDLKKRKEYSSYGFIWCFLGVRFQLEYYIKDVEAFAEPLIWRLPVPICSPWHFHKQLGDQSDIARGPSPAFPCLKKSICSSGAIILLPEPSTHRLHLLWGFLHSYRTPMPVPSHVAHLWRNREFLTWSNCCQQSTCQDS